MSLLAPLYFLGALAIGLPILFHLIRRQPKGQIEFSSLMFLRPTPPRLTRRSRLDNWPLLLLRALALMLLAAAFARPFLRSASLSDSALPGRRLVLVVDTSASMQRTGLWQQALDRANAVLKDLQPADQLAIVTFDQKPRTLIGFEQSGELPPEQLKATAKSLLRDVAPSWHRTEMGRAISFAGDLAVTYEPEDKTEVGLNASDLSDAAAASGQSATGPAHMILISDMQAGSHMESLQVYTWPKELRLDVRKVSSKGRTNAAAQILAASIEAEEDTDRVRVRVSNSPDATESRFRMRWSAGSAESTAPAAELAEFPVQVPPGQSRVVRMPAPAPGVTALVVQGDDHSFDNTRYIVSPQPDSLTLLHIGKVEADPRDSLLYYLQRVPLNNDRRIVSVQTLAPDKLEQVPDVKKVPLAVVGSAVSSDVATRLREYVTAGGRVLVVLSDADGSDTLAASLNAIAESNVGIAEAEIDDYVMFSRIDFGHAVFQPMADPKFNDFTKIRFWSHRTIENLDEAAWQVVAQFDDGDPALIEQEIGEGHLFVLAAGWQPKASQLALSTKFIPLVFGFFDSSPADAGADQYTVGQPVAFEASESATITTPAGTAVEYRSVEDLEAIDQPGVYEYRDGDISHSFAVNLDESESHTEAIDEGELERFGVLLGKNVTTEQARESRRQLRDQELERDQKLWQWLIVVALGLLGLETFLGMIWSLRRDGGELEHASA
jgi:hypothetical protein